MWKDHKLEFVEHKFYEAVKTENFNFGDKLSAESINRESGRSSYISLCASAVCSTPGVGETTC